MPFSSLYRSSDGLRKQGTALFFLFSLMPLINQPGMAETAQALGGSLQDIVRQDEFYGLTAETISTILKGKYAGDGWLWDFRTIM